MFRPFLLSSVLIVLFFSVLNSPPELMADDENSSLIVDTMNGAGYTYLQLNDGKKSYWAAIPETAVKTGDKVKIRDGLLMEDFYSKTLDKTFETIIFSPGLQHPGNPSEVIQQIKTKAPETESFSDAVKTEMKQSTAVSSSQRPSGGSSSAVVPAVEVDVEKAVGENSYTIEEIFTRIQDLNGKQVQIRGKVVKFNRNIMGKNWIHLQDGSGNPMKNSHDLVVTTADEVDLEDVVLVKGKITADKDFGFGYKYEALLEEAVIVR